MPKAWHLCAFRERFSYIDIIMGSYTQLLYHIVFSTKHRQPVISPNGERRLYTYIWNTLKSKKSVVHRIGGVEDHIHILTSIHQSIAVADLVRTVKANSSRFIKEQKVFKSFEGWQNGYGCFSCDYKDLDALKKYISSQKEHHKHISFIDEYKDLLKQHNIEFEEKYLV